MRKFRNIKRTENSISTMVTVLDRIIIYGSTQHYRLKTWSELFPADLERANRLSHALGEISSIRNELNEDYKQAAPVPRLRPMVSIDELPIVDDDEEIEE
jgi:hypothetical protein